MTDWTCKTNTELLEEWLGAVEQLQNLHRLRSELRADTQPSDARWTTVSALDEIVAREAARANELRYRIEDSPSVIPPRSIEPTSSRRAAGQSVVLQSCARSLGGGASRSASFGLVPTPY